MHSSLRFALALAAVCQLPMALAAAPANTPAPATAQAALEAEWQTYITRSQELRKLDQQQLRKEMKRRGLKEPLLPAYTKEFGFETEQPLEWFTSTEGKAIMEAILSLQTPTGGWSKRTDMTKKRKPGMAFGNEKNYIPTFDNGATTTQLRWLAAFYPYADANLQALVLPALEKGVQFVLTAQYPNGGFAQTYPLRGGYHDAVTLNDQVMVE